MKVSKVLEISGSVILAAAAGYISDVPVFGALCMSFLIYVVYSEITCSSRTSEKISFLVAVFPASASALSTGMCLSEAFYV